jgi:hypothetical protein
MNWDTLAEECCREHGCSDQQISMAMAGPYSRTIVQDMRRKQNDVRTSADAVRRAYLANPHASREEMRRQSYKFILGGIILSVILQALLSAVAKMAVEWFLNHIFNKQETSNGGISLPTKQF